jgi:2-deoxy-D-gluconate 3-dehydrogenase
VYPELKRRGGGKILTIGSMASIFGFDVAAVYAATKGGVVQLTRSLASAWARDNVQVNCILPGWINTALTRRARQVLPALQDNVLDRTPSKRWGEPEDLAGAAVFFCSGASDYVTGTALPVDGGFSSSMF